MATPDRDASRTYRLDPRAFEPTTFVRPFMFAPLLRIAEHFLRNAPWMR